MSIKAQVEQMIAQLRDAMAFSDWQRVRQCADDLAALLPALEGMEQRLKEARNMARHNYRCAVHEQMHASEHGIAPANTYPPLVDDEYAALEQRLRAALAAGAQEPTTKKGGK